MTTQLRPPGLRERVGERVNEHFAVRERGSSIPIEILGGVSVFLSMAYIVLVNPAILAEGGIPWSGAFVATALVAGLATIAMGLWARLPFAVAPGMEINALVVYSVIGTHHFTWQQALGLVLASGVLMLLVTAFGLRYRVIEAIPADVRAGLVLSVGVFIGTVGLKVAGIIGGHGPALRALTTHSAIALYIGLAVIGVLALLRIRAAVLVGIVVAGVYCAVVGLRPPDPGPADPTAALFALDLGALLQPGAWGVVLVLFALDFFGSVAKLVGLTASTTIQRDGTVPRMQTALYVDSMATVGGAAVGSTSFVTFVESGVGIRLGARTGLAAVTTGVLLLCTLFFAPIAKLVSVNAAAGALLFVAIGTLPRPRDIRAGGAGVLATSLVMAVVTAVTSALDQALLAGLLIHVCALLIRRTRPEPTLLFVTMLLAASVVLQYLT